MSPCLAHMSDGTFSHVAKQILSEQFPIMTITSDVHLILAKRDWLGF